MNKTIKKVVLFPAIILLLSSCNITEKNKAVEEVSYSYKPSFIILNVKDIDIVDRTDSNSIQSQYKPPINPKHAIINWAENRLRAKGNVGKIEFIIKEASFKEEKLKNESGELIELFKRGEHNKYNARYVISMKLYSDDTSKNKVSEIEVEAFSTRNIEGVISLAEKDRLIKEMLKELLDNAEKQIEHNITTYFMANNYLLWKAKDEL